MFLFHSCLLKRTRWRSRCLGRSPWPCLCFAVPKLCVSIGISLRIGAPRALAGLVSCLCACFQTLEELQSALLVASLPLAVHAMRRQRWRCLTPQLQLLSPAAHTRTPPHCPKLISAHTGEPACQDIQLQWLIPRLCANSKKTWKWGSQQVLQGMRGFKSVINKWLLCFCLAAIWLRFALKKQFCCEPLLAGPVNAFAPARSSKGKPKMTPRRKEVQKGLRPETVEGMGAGPKATAPPPPSKVSTPVNCARNWNLKGINGAQGMSSTAISPLGSRNHHRLPPLAEQTFANLSSKLGFLAFLAWLLDERCDCILANSFSKAKQDGFKKSKNDFSWNMLIPMTKSCGVSQEQLPPGETYAANRTTCHSAWPAHQHWLWAHGRHVPIRAKHSPLPVWQA